MSFSTLDSELTGPLFTTAAMRAVFADRARLAAMLRVEVALARAQGRSGLVPDGLADAIAAIGAQDLDLDRIGAAAAEAGVPVIPFVKAVGARLEPTFEAYFHTGATTQDIADTALVLQMAEAFTLLAADIDSILAGLAALAERYRATPCVGRSYGQHAAPISFGYRLAVWLAGIAEAAADLPRIKRRVLVASLGGPVGILAACGDANIAVLEAFAAELGLGVPAITWHTLRGRMAEAGMWVATLIGALAKMAIDVVHLSMTEVAEVAEPHAPGRGGSSAMPHKRNPVSATIILAAHSSAKSLVPVLLEAMAAADERPAGGWHAEWGVLPTLFGLASGALAEGRRLAEGLQVDPTRMQANLELTRGLVFADAVAARLAQSMGRQRAHAILEAAADKVRDTGQSLREVLWEDPSLSREAQASIDAAFDLAPAMAAAGRFVDRALAEATAIRDSLKPCLDTSP